MSYHFKLIIFCVLVSATGVLKGFDALLNIVLDNTTEYLRGKGAVTLLYAPFNLKLQAGWVMGVWGGGGGVWIQEMLQDYKLFAFYTVTCTKTRNNATKHLKRKYRKE